ncbi:MAG TPA: sulfatase [Candidatus Limnocylindrales bacterium]
MMAQSRQRFLAPLAVLAAVAALGLSATGSQAQAADPRPNIVLIMTDDQTLASMSVMPNVRNLIGAQGTTFSQNWVSYPLCCPSRATYLTGQYPHNHDVFDNKPPDGGYEKLRGGQTLPVWLHDSGYKTVHIGKYLNGYGNRNPLEVPPGWEFWHGLVDAYRMWGYSINHHGNNVQRYGQVGEQDPALYQTDVLRDIATNFIENHANGTRPFFLSWAPLAPHTEVGTGLDLNFRNPRPAPRHRGQFNDEPLPRPPAFNENGDGGDMSDKPAFLRRGPLDANEIDNITKRYRSRLESLLAVDEAVKAIVDKLRAEGVLSNTVLIFTADNGFMDGQHRIEAGKVHAYNPSARVPLLIRGQGIPAGQTTPAMVSNVDLAATVLDFANTAPGIRIDGRSLKPVAQNPASVAGRRVLLETGAPRARSIGDRWYAAIRGERYLYVEHWLRNADGVDVRTGKELYDDNVDPHQLESKHDNPGYADIMAGLAQRLHEMQTCSGSTCL